MLEHKGYVGTIQIDPDERSLYGKVVNIDGEIFYEGETIRQLEQGMRDALDNYLALCDEQGLSPRKPFSGDLRLRMPPAIHARIAATAASLGKSMNEVVLETVTERFGGNE